jgi:fluoroacetyl-CoA thioesterase
LRPIPPHYEGRVSVVVTEEMTVDFAELGRIHPVYATYWLAKHMEEAGRKIIIPFLEEDENGIGSAVAVRHLAPAVPGTRIEIVAEHERTDGNRVYARCRARTSRGVLVGEGETEQTILPQSQIAERIAAAEATARDPRSRPSPPAGGGGTSRPSRSP